MYDVVNLTKTYRRRNEAVNALDSISLHIPPKSFIAITGPSGSGKTTLMLSLGGLVRPTSGEVSYNRTSIYSLSDKKLAEYRNRSIGFVLQTFNLIPYLSAIENVMIPMVVNRESNGNGRFERAAGLLEKMNLGSRAHFLPREISVGQQQRVAIARALANDPDVVLADEPTGNLDPGLSDEILQVMKRLHEDDGKTIIMVTHDPQAAGKAKQVLYLEDGKFADQKMIR